MVKVARFEACPRRALAAAATSSGTSLAALSRMLRRPDGYLSRFVREGRPLALSEDDHRALSDHFGAGPRGLGIRELWVPM